MNVLDVLFLVVGVVLLITAVTMVVKLWRVSRAVRELHEASQTVVGQLWAFPELYRRWYKAAGRVERKVVLVEAAAGFLAKRPGAVDELLALVERLFMLDFKQSLYGAEWFPESRLDGSEVDAGRSFNRMFVEERERREVQLAEGQRSANVMMEKAEAVWAGLTEEERTMVRCVRGRTPRATTIRKLSPQWADEHLSVFLSAVALYATEEPA